MSLEAAIQALTDAVKENTAQHAAFAEIARQGAKAGTAAKSGTAANAAPKAEEKPAPKAEQKPEAEEKPAKAAPAKAAGSRGKATGTKAKKAPELPTEVDQAELRGLARSFMAKDNENRDKNKENFAAALAHLGAENLSSVGDEDAPKLFGYITYWNEGLEVNFEEIDALVSDASEDGGSGESEDELLG